MNHQADCTRIEELVVETLLVLEGHDWDTTLLVIGEVLARLLAEHPDDPEESLTIVRLAVRKWLDSGKLTPQWQRQAERVRVQ